MLRNGLEARINNFPSSLRNSDAIGQVLDLLRIHASDGQLIVVIAASFVGFLLSLLLL